MPARMFIAVLALAGCAPRGGPELPAPNSSAEAARHRAALASVVVANETSLPLTIAFRTATPPLQEVVIGRVAAAARAKMAPIPAGEPIILVARREDGAEFQMQARSFSLDAEFEWAIPKDATFQTPPQRK
jgi:hypothetical protein